MKKVIGYFAGFLIFLFFISSCQSIGTIVQEPKVSVKSVDLDSIDFTGVDMICHLNVENPNVFEIPFPEIEWRLYINANSFINGTIKNNARLGGSKTITVDVPFSVTYSGLFNSFASLMNSREAAYRIELGLRFPILLLEEKTFNLDFSGNIPLLQIPKITGASFKTGRIDLTGVEQDMVFTIENPNVFPIPFPQMEWDYGVNGAAVLKGSVDARGEIAALSQSPVTVSVGVKYADLLSALGSFGQSAELQSVMNLNSHFPVPAFGDLDFNLNIPAVIPVFHKPELSFSGINIKNLALQKLDFIISWEITNPNNFSLNLGSFNYSLTVNNSQWAQGAVAPSSPLKPNSKTVIPAEITISSISLITQIIDIINRGSSVSFNSIGSFDFSGDLPGLDKMDLPFDLSGVTRLLRM